MPFLYTFLTKMLTSHSSPHGELFEVPESPILLSATTLLIWHGWRGKRSNSFCKEGEHLEGNGKAALRSTADTLICKEFFGVTF